MQDTAIKQTDPNGLKPSPFYPGFTLGIAGFALSLNATIVGLVLSIIAYRKSKAAGYRNGLAYAGIIVGSVGTALVLAYFVLIFALVITGSFSE